MEGNEVFLDNNGDSEVSFGYDSEVSPKGNDDPWTRIGAEVPFREDKDAMEPPKVEAETDSYTFDGVEYKNVDKIDVLNDKGKAICLKGSLENDALSAKVELNESIRNGDNSEVNRQKSKLDSIERQLAILQEIDDDDDDNDNLLDSLEGAYHDSDAKLNKMIENGNTSQGVIDEEYKNRSAIYNLLGLAESEIIRRDSNYFGSEEMRNELASKIKRAERGVDETMLSGYVDEDGLIHITEDGERLPSVATENAKIILEEAKRDTEVFDSLMGIYAAEHNYQVPRAIKKKDFKPFIDGYVDGHKNQINRLTAELGYLTKGTTEYLEKEAEIKKQKQHRNAAIRLLTTYFG